MKKQFGDILAQEVSGRICTPQTTMAALKSIPKAGRVNGMVVTVLSDYSYWVWNDTSVLNGDDILVSTPSDAPAAGRWLRDPGGTTALALPFTFATADAAALLTIQAGQKMRIWDAYWQVDVAFTGGAGSAIGVSSSLTGFTTKGDILGGATGDVAATLVATAPGLVLGTIGAKFGTIANARLAHLISGNVVRLDRITSAFTAGSGSVILEVDLLTNVGA